jgi:hypothetical protein
LASAELGLVAWAFALRWFNADDCPLCVLHLEMAVV